MKTNHVSSFMYYMYNRFSLSECIALFGEELGHHIYGKYLRSGDIFRWYSELDYSTRDTIVERATQIFDSHGKQL